MKKSRYLVVGLFSIFLFAGCSSTKERAHPSASNRSTAISTSVSSSSKITPSTSISSTSETTSSTVATTTETTSQPANIAGKGSQLSDAQRNQINLAFLNWASQRAAIGNMAVSDWFFDHGAAGHGDWYANTPDGQVQVQNNNMPGKNAFSIRAIGGCIFYTAKDGGVGKQELFADSFAANYSVKLDDTKPVSKYLLGDNGVVYELKTGNGMPVSTNTGFGEYADDGSQGNYKPDLNFQVSEDQAAQAELKELIQSY